MDTFVLEIRFWIRLSKCWKRISRTVQPLVLEKNVRKITATTVLLEKNVQNITAICAYKSSFLSVSKFLTACVLRCQYWHEKEPFIGRSLLRLSLP